MSQVPVAHGDQPGTPPSATCEVIEVVERTCEIRLCLQAQPASPGWLRAQAKGEVTNQWRKGLRWI